MFHIYFFTLKSSATVAINVGSKESLATAFKMAIILVKFKVLKTAGFSLVNFSASASGIDHSLKIFSDTFLNC